MILKSLFNDLDIAKVDYFYLGILLFFSVAMFIVKVMGYKTIGMPDSDVIVYLCNSLYYAGLNINNIIGTGYLYSSPVICFLTAILFKVWHVSLTPILIVTGVFEIFGNIGLYLLLKNRFNPILSALGTILYSTSALFVYHSSSGMLDIPAVAISIWIMVFAVLAMDKNYKYYLIAIPLLVIGVFTRPTVGFMLPLIVLMFLYKHDLIKIADCALNNRPDFQKKLSDSLKSEEFKYILISCILGTAILLIIIAYHYFYFNLELPFIGGVQRSMERFGDTRVSDYYFNNDIFYFIKLLPHYFIPDSAGYLNMPVFYIAFLVTVSGFILKLIDFMRNKVTLKQNCIDGYYKTKNLELILRILFVLLLVIGIISFKINYMITEILFFIDFLILMSILKKYNVDDFKYGISMMFVAWFVFYLIFISFINMKMERYAMPLLIPLVFFVVFSLDGILSKFSIDLNKNKLENRTNKEKIAKIILLLLILMFMVNAFIVINHNFNEVYSHRYNDYQNAANYLQKHDPNWMNKNITADRFQRFHSWFFNVPINYIDHKLYPWSAFDSSGSDYLLISVDYDFENYTKIYHEGEARIYEKNNLTY